MTFPAGTTPSEQSIVSGASRAVPLSSGFVKDGACPALDENGYEVPDGPVAECCAGPGDGHLDFLWSTCGAVHVLEVFRDRLNGIFLTYTGHYVTCPKYVLQSPPRCPGESSLPW